MERSAELVATTQKFYDAMATGDETAITGLLSSADGVLLIGTDPDEWLTDRPSMLTLLTAQAGTGLKVRSGDIQAFEEGSVGWVADRGAFILPDGSEVPFRMTAVFHKQDDDWKMIQSHASVAVSNEDAMGVEL